MALTSELRRFEMPPVNPYLASKPLHYYWTYFLVPAAITAPAPRPSVTSMTRSKRMQSRLHSSWRRRSTRSRQRPSGAGWPLRLRSRCVISGVERRRPCAHRQSARARTIALAPAWRQRGCRDRLVVRRAADRWRAPDDVLHAAAWDVVCARYPCATRPERRWRGVDSNGSHRRGAVARALHAFNPFLGAAFCPVYGAAVLLDLVVNRRPLRSLPVHALAALPPFWRSAGALPVRWATARAAA